MLVSVIIPIYNVEPYIKRCLLSVLNQTYQDLEIILIDDCSPDKSIDIALQVIENYPDKKGRVIFAKHDHNQGLSAARNTGINLAKGDYLYFLDSDDELLLNTFDLFVRKAKEYSFPDFLTADFELINATSNKADIGLKMDESCISDKNEILSLFIKRYWPVMACNKLIKRNFLLDYKIFFKEGILHEDELWSFMLANYASTMVAVPAKTYKYYIRHGSITSHVGEKNVESCCIICEEIQELLKRREMKNKLNIANLEACRNSGIRMLLKLKNDKIAYNYYSRLRNIKNANQHTTLNKTIISIILKLPSRFGFFLLKNIYKS